MVLNTYPSGWPAASHGTSEVVSPARTAAGGRSVGAVPISQRKVASRSMAIPFAADPQTTGNTDADATPWASVSSSSLGFGTSPSR